MPRLSKKTMFAIEAVLDVAFHVGEHPVRSGDITERQRIPKRYLEQVLQHLVRAGILNGKRGPRGGYRLGREQRVASPWARSCGWCASSRPRPSPTTLSIGSPLAHEVVWPMWEKLRDDMMAQLDNITIEDLCQRARAKGLERRRRSAADRPSDADLIKSAGLIEPEERQMAKAKTRRKPNPTRATRSSTTTA